jgi:hypothetical protein
MGSGQEAEAAAHRRMLELGYPVARILRTGCRDDVPYLIEESLGTTTLGDRFALEHGADGHISDQGFASYLAVAERYAEAQASAVAVAGPAALSRLIGLEAAVVLVADVEGLLREAFAAAQSTVEQLPRALVHPDLHAFNMCPGGVIDLEDVDWGPAGYDVATAPFVQELCGLADSGARWFSEGQVAEYLAMVDRVFADHGLPVPTDRLDALLVCRAIALCAKQHPVPAVRAAREGVLRRVIDGFLSGVGVRSVLRDGA